MATGLIAFLVTLLIVALIWWAWTQLRGLLPLPEPIGTILNVLVVVILCVAVIYAVAGIFEPGYGFGRLLR